MKVWINSSEAGGVTDGSVCWNYVEEPTRENKPLGCVTQHPGKKVWWLITDGGMGEVDTVDEAKRIVESAVKIVNRFDNILKVEKPVKVKGEQNY
jgi:hypothetical protein